jgi:hypothetical protein
VDGKDGASLRDAVKQALGEAMEAGEVADAVIAQSHTQARTRSCAKRRPS